MSWDDDNKEGPWKKQGTPDPEEMIRKLKEFLGGGGYMGALVVAGVLIFFSHCPVFLQCSRVRSGLFSGSAEWTGS